MATEPNAANQAKSRDRQGARGKEMKKLGKYKIKKKIGAGGMGAVFLGVDEELKRTVALKVLPKEKAENPTLVKRFKSEAQAAAHLKHENIVTVYEAGEADGFLYMALEYVEGVDVHNLVNKRGVLPVKRSINIIKQLVKALQHAYDQSIVHRDIKPANILIQRDGTVKLTDMGLARSVDESSETGITRAGTTVGTVDYMAPEQARSSKAADTRSDIYSLGCTWYHMLTGSPPFPEGSLMNKLNAHATKPPPDPRDVNDSVPEMIIAIMHRMMAKAQDDRYQTPQELLDDLENTNLKRTDVAADDLAHLSEATDEDDTYEFPAAPTRTGPQAPPPRKDRKKKDDDDDSKGTKISLQPVKIVAIVAAAILVVVGVGWGMQQFGNVFDDGDDGTGQLANPFNREELDDAYNQASGNKKDDTSESGNEDPDGSSKGSKSNGKTGNGRVAYSTSNSAIVAASSTLGQEDPIAEDAPKFGSRLILPSLASMGRPGERQYFTDWIDEVSKPMSDEFPTFTIGFDKKGGYRFDSLDNALRRIPESGAAIEIATDGPFYVKPVQLRSRESVVIRAALNSRPIIVLVPDESNPANKLIDVAKGSLTLDGVHVHVSADSFVHSLPLTAIAVDAGHFAAINSTITLNGTRRAFTVALELSGSVFEADKRSQKRSRVLLNNVMVRGNNFTAFNFDVTAVDFLATNCLFATGTGPVITLINRQKINNSDRIKLQPSRRFTFTSTTIQSNKAAFEFGPGIEAANPPDTNITTVNSVMAGRGRSSLLMELSGWPKSKGTKANNMFQGLTWSTHSSLFCGWDRLLEVAVGDTLTVRDDDGWCRVWGAGGDDTHIQVDEWPRTQFADYGRVFPQMFDVASLNVSLLTTTDGVNPGCIVGSLQLPVALASRRAEVLARHGQAPEVKSTEFKDVNTIQIDLRDKDLGKVLGDLAWQDGTLVIAYGSGIRESSPINVDGKSLRIEFVPTGDKPLILEALIRGGKQDEDESFFSVKNGTLELINATVKIPDRSGAPNCFLAVEDGSFSLQNCTVQGPVRSTGRFDSMINWKKSTSGNAGRQFGAITNSYLVGTGTMLKADMPKRAFYLRNSLLVSLNELFQLRIPNPDADISGAVDIQNSTLSAAATFFNINTNAFAAKATSPLTMFVSETVFAPAVDPGVKPAPTQAVLSFDQSVQSNHQLDWWGQSNGYATTIRHYLRRPNQSFDSPPQRLKEVLLATWKAEQLSRPLSNTEGVILRVGDLPDRSQLKLESFALHPSSGAYGWGRNKMPIGFDPSEWKAEPKKEDTTSSSTAKTQSKKKKDTGTKKTKSTSKVVF